MSLERFCRKPMVTVRPDDTVLDAAEHMLGSHVGAVVVSTTSGVPVGILTDRDVVCRVVARGLDPRKVHAKEAMSGDVCVIPRTASLDEAVVKLRQRGVRRLPIVEGDGRLAGLVSMDDLVVLLSSELRQVAGVPRENRGP